MTQKEGGLWRHPSAWSSGRGASGSCMTSCGLQAGGCLRPLVDAKAGSTDWQLGGCEGGAPEAGKAVRGFWMTRWGPLALIALLWAQDRPLLRLKQKQEWINLENLCPDSLYELQVRVRAQRDDNKVWSPWSQPLAFRTKPEGTGDLWWGGRGGKQLAGRERVGRDPVAISSLATCQPGPTLQKGMVRGKASLLALGIGGGAERLFLLFPSLTHDSCFPPGLAGVTAVGWVLWPCQLRAQAEWGPSTSCPSPQPGAPAQTRRGWGWWKGCIRKEGGGRQVPDGHHHVSPFQPVWVASQRGWV